jgi:multidrug efflux pump subunit AcrB
MIGNERRESRRISSVALTLSQALDAVKTFPILKELPSDVTVSPGGDAELQDELFEGFNTAMWEGLTMAYVVLALLFGSLLHPLTIMFSLPLSVSGTIMALYLAGGLAVTTPVLIGILMSMGIVTKNAIMLVDFAVESIRKGTDRTAGIIDAAHKRAQPIMMTSIAMAAGMAPSALGIGLGGEFRSPMAIAVIGGILVSTFLSLLFVPAFFTVIDDLGLWLVRLAGGMVRDAHKAAPVHAEH